MLNDTINTLSTDSKNKTVTVRIHRSTYDLISKQATSLSDTYDSVILRCLLSAQKGKSNE